MNNMTKDEENEEQNSLMKKLEEMDNKLERIKSDTNSLKQGCLSFKLRRNREGTVEGYR